MNRLVGVFVLGVVLVGSALAHDIWLEPNANLVRTGEWLRISLMLGNHGNQHRDFRLASKVSAGDQNLVLYGPDNARYDLTKSLIDNGLTPQEGYWSARYQPTAPGLYMAVSSMDKVMSYAPVRDVKSAKTFFVVSPGLDNVAGESTGYDRVVGLPLEIVPLVNPVVGLRAGSAMRIRVLYKGKPLANANVTFVPKGATPKGDLDPLYEKSTDAKGEVEMVLKEGNSYLIATHKEDPDAKGTGYQSVGYSATLCVLVSSR